MAVKLPMLMPLVFLGVVTMTSGCVIRETHDDGGARAEAYREGYYDREHSRYYHEHAWHECREHDDFCH